MPRRRDSHGCRRRRDRGHPGCRRGGRSIELNAVRGGCSVSPVTVASGQSDEQAGHDAENGRGGDSELPVGAKVLNWRAGIAGDRLAGRVSWLVPLLRKRLRGAPYPA